MNNKAFLSAKEVTSPLKKGGYTPYIREALLNMSSLENILYACSDDLEKL